MVEVSELLMSAYNIIRTYGIIEYDQNTQDKNGYHRKMVIVYKGNDYFIRMTNGNVTGVRII